MAQATVSKHSAGGVVFRQTGDEYEVVLVGTQKGRVWGLPKGQVEEGETPVNAALRKVFAESGIRALAGPHIDQTEYWYAGKSQGRPARFHKKVDYYLMRALTDTLVASKWDIDEVVWLPIDEAVQQATYLGEREILARARTLLKSPGPGVRLLPPLLVHLLDDLPAATLEALAETDLWVDDVIYAIVAVTSDERDNLLATLGKVDELITIDDGDEFTVVLDERHLAGLLPLFNKAFQAERSYRFVRLEATLPWDTVGYGAAIFAALASAGISAGFFSGYSIDYLLVSDRDLAVALASLEVLIGEAKRLLAPKAVD